MSWTRHDALLDALYQALERWDAGERTAHDLRAITKAQVQRVDRAPDGSRIPAPRRGAMARYLAAAALTALHEWEDQAAAEVPEP